MTQQFDRLEQLLRELFQLNEPELDFGLYRILHAKSGEVTQFLDQELLPQVRQALAQHRSAVDAASKADLDRALEPSRALGAAPESLPKRKERRAKLASGAVSLAALEGEVFDHLHDFFRRYYHEGDFLSRRVYKPGVYAIPYEGEEVHLHWANKDQYYVKSSEHLRDSTFRLRPDDARNPLRVHFRLVDVAEGEHGNVKATEGKERRFVLASEDFAHVERGELTLRFEYRPVRPEDWPEALRSTKSKPPTQRTLDADAVARVLASTDESLRPWIEELSRPAPTESQPARCVLARHLETYTKAHTFDYFIHKDLGGFLRRELDFYIKNEVLHLDDLEQETAPKLEQSLSKVRVLRRIAGKLIDFLAQLESFQKRLWLKQKFVVETSWCVSLGVIPSELYAEIAANGAQREEWGRLCAIDEIQRNGTTPGYREPLAPEFLAAHPSLVLDTRCFDADFTARLLEGLGDLEALADGVLVHGENFQALRLMRARYREQVQCTYIDPPYNTGDDGFPYKDAYRRSSWLAMMHDRLLQGRELERDDGVVVISIDDAELSRLSELVLATYGDQELAKLVWDRNRKNDAKFFSVGHEYMLVAARNREGLKARGAGFREPKEGIEEARALFATLVARHGEDWERVREGWLKWFETIPVSDPRRRMLRYTKVGPRGPFRDDGDISWPGGGGPRYPILHPTTGKPCAIPSRGWMYGSPERFWEAHRAGDVVLGKDHTTVPSIARYLLEGDDQVMPSVFYSYAQTASQEFDALFGGRVFDNPKNWRDIRRVVRYLGAKDAHVLDYFAGSGTTAHAVIHLNREDGGRRKFLLVEMGGYFDTVLVPRIKKVTFTPEWKDGKPARMATREQTERAPRVVKVIRLESYEDTLNNLALRRTQDQHETLFCSDAGGAGGFREDYLLRYMLDVETRGSASLLDVRAFYDPTRYTLVVKRPGSDESREVAVDLLETFNWLIGLVVRALNAPQTLRAEFTRSKHGRLEIQGRLVPDATGPWWFRTVAGELRSGERVLVIWRKRPGGESVEGLEQDNLVLDEWLRTTARSTDDLDVDLIYVNGDNNLPNVRRDGESWKVRLIEEDFQRLMFEGAEA
jgi:adenine-specific DNA-methyltransferase